MIKYSQGICGNGAAILEDGRMMTVDEIVQRLNEFHKMKSKSSIVELTPKEKEIALQNMICDMCGDIEG